MKQVTILFSDLHINSHNTFQVLDVCQQIKNYAVVNGIKIVFFLGDAFDVRAKQTIYTLKCFHQVIEIFASARIILVCIPGNHDKIDLESEDSYMDIYSSEYFQLITTYDCVIPAGKVAFHCIPYFKESTIYRQYLSEVKQIQGRKNFLLTHVAVNGVMNNDGSIVSKAIKLKELERFDKVYIGHYHNRQSFGNCVYIGSTFPHNYGEDNKKGFIVINEDGSHKYFRLKFKEFQKLDIDFDQQVQHYLDNPNFYINNLVSLFNNKEANKRVVFIGKSVNLDRIDHVQLKELGLDVKFKRVDNVSIETGEVKEFLDFDTDSLAQYFKEYCEENMINEETFTDGEQLLKSF